MDFLNRSRDSQRSTIQAAVPVTTFAINVIALYVAIRSDLTTKCLVIPVVLFQYRQILLQLLINAKEDSTEFGIGVGLFSAIAVYLAAILFVFRRYSKKSKQQPKKPPAHKYEHLTSPEEWWSYLVEEWSGVMGTPLPWKDQAHLSKSWLKVGDGYKASLVDRIKLSLEAFSGEEWVWWPLKRPQKTSEAGYRRLYFNDISGVSYWIDTPNALAFVVQKLAFDKIVGAAASIPGKGASTSNTTDFPKDQAPTTVGTMSTDPGSAGRSANASQSQSQPLQASQTSSDPNNDSKLYEGNFQRDGNLFSQYHVLYGVYSGSRMKHGIIDLPLLCIKNNASSFCDHQFVTSLSRQIKFARGWRHYLSTRRLHHFTCALFEKFGPDTLEYAKDELPPEMDKIYLMNRRHLPFEDEQPISTNQWYHRLYNDMLHPNPTCAMELVEHVPKRTSPFQLAIHRYDGTDTHHYGLYAVLAPCWLTIMAYQILIFILPLVFYVYHLVKSPGDQQNAIVPWTIVIGAEMLLWAPLCKFFDDRKRR